MDIREIRELSDEELLDELEDQRNNWRLFRFQKATGQLEDTNSIRKTRRIIARLQTVRRERELARELAAEEGTE